MSVCCGLAVELLNFLTTDPKTIGVVTWVSLVVTVAGFSIAIAQLRRVKKSSAAAAEAVSNLAKVIRSQEQHTNINSAIGHLTSAQGTMQRNAEATAIHLSNAWTALLAAREMTADNTDRDIVSRLVLSTRQLLDDINAPAIYRSMSAEVTAQRHAAVSERSTN